MRTKERQTSRTGAKSPEIIPKDVPHSFTHRDHAKKSTGEIGATRIAETSAGTTAEIIHTELPDDKEGLERYFASPFVTVFNERRPLGDDVLISGLRQNKTHDLDFAISCPAADYLELAELNPRSETFGKAAYRTGKLNVYEYARWIWFRLISKKARKYGELSSRVILLLYLTHWQFAPSERVVECLNSFVDKKECRFAGVFILLTNGNDLVVLHTVHPYVGPALPAVSRYSGVTTTNLPPGQHRWTLTD